MSVDSTALERATLERKDRDELVAIVQALGGKVPSRAKKADIVDTILELTGVSGGEAAEPAPARAPRAKKAAAPPAEPAPEAAKAEPEASAPDAPPAEEAPTDEAPAAEAPAEEQPATKEPAPGGGGGDRGQSGQGNGNRNQSGDRSDGATEGDGDGEETGNRRRRRRGRNRGDGQGDEPIGDPVEVEGIVDLRDEGYGFLRLHGFLPSRDDAYISVKQARQFGLRRGDIVRGASRPALRNEKNPALLRIDTVNGAGPDEARERQRFEDLTAVLPDEEIGITVGGTTVALGERTLVHTTGGSSSSAWLRQAATAVAGDPAELALFVVLVDERPEEVTEWERAVSGEGAQVVATTFDRPADDHVQVAELAIERAKRLAEAGQDVVVVLDGLTRLARAGTLVTTPTGRALPGGADAAVLHAVKRVFGAGRRLEGSGTLTLLATLRTGTGSALDEAFADELRAVANRELVAADDEA